MILKSCPVCGSSLSKDNHLSTGKTEETFVEIIICYSMSDNGIESTTTRSFPKGFRFEKPKKELKPFIPERLITPVALVPCNICGKECKPSGLIIHKKRMHKEMAM